MYLLSMLVILNWNPTFKAHRKFELNSITLKTFGEYQVTK
jgi:hypothetical protein